MKRGDKTFVSNTSLFCCSKHFSEKDYRKSLAGKRCDHDLVKKAVPSIFPWSMTKSLKGPKEPKVVNAKGFNFLHVHPRVWKTNITYTMHLTSLKRRLKAKIQIKNHSKKRETYMPRIKILNKSCFFQNLVWRGLDRMMMTYFSTKDFGVTEPWWHFGTLLNLALSLRCRGTQPAKKWEKAPQTILIHFLFFQEKKSKEIEREK